MKERILKLRQFLKLSQGAFGEKIGVSASAVSRYEKGEMLPSDSVIISICNVFNVNQQWLQYGHGSIFIEKSSTDAIDQLMVGDNEFAKSVMRAFASMDDDAWKALQHVVKSLVENKGSQLLENIPMTPISLADADENEDDGDDLEDEEEPKCYLPLLGGAAAGSPIYHPADDGDTVIVPERYADPDRYAVFQARGDSMEPRIPNGAFIVTEVNVLPADGEVAVVMLSSFSDAEYVVKRVYRKRNSAILRSYNPKYTDMEVAADEVRSAYRMVEIIR